MGIKEPETLPELIERRAKFLTGYQDAKLADRYRALVQKVEAAEAKLGKKRDLTNAVARFYFKLLAYKDEYEVARLYTNGEFEKQMKETFDGNLKVTFNLAPPIFKGETMPDGRPKKRTFGPWMFRAFKLLAAMKGLRGTSLDVFGYSAERKMERALIAEYEALVDTILAKLNSDNHHFATALARLPDEIRGYGPVKEKAIEKVKKVRADLLNQFNNPQRIVKSAEAVPAE